MICPGFHASGLIARGQAERPVTPTRRLQRKTSFADVTSARAEVVAAKDDEPQRPLALLFERYPQLRSDPVAISSLEAWRDDPESARIYAENAARAGWPGVKFTSAAADSAEPRWTETVIGKALGAGSHARDAASGGRAQGPSPRRQRAGNDAGSPLLRAASAAEQKAKAARLEREQAPEEVLMDSKPEVSAHTQKKSTASGRLAVAVQAAAKAKAAAKTAAAEKAEGVARAAHAASSSSGAGLPAERVYGSRESPAVASAALAWR